MKTKSKITPKTPKPITHYLGINLDGNYIEDTEYSSTFNGVSKFDYVIKLNFPPGSKRAKSKPDKEITFE